MPIHRANEGRLNSALDKKYNFDGPVMSLREKIGQGYTRLTVQQKEINRRVYNRLGMNEQEEYERKCANSYSYTFWDKNGNGWDIPKIVYDHLLSKGPTE